MRRARHDPQGWLRLLHPVRAHGNLRVIPFRPHPCLVALPCRAPAWVIWKPKEGTAGHSPEGEIGQALARGSGPTGPPLAVPLSDAGAAPAGFLPGHGAAGCLGLLGGCVAWVGLAWMASLFWRLVLCSQAPDQVHAHAIGVALGVGVLSLLGMCLSLVCG